MRVRIDGMIVRLDDVGALEKQKKHSIELVIDRITINRDDKGRLTDSVETALREGKGKLMVEVDGREDPARRTREANACPKCGIGFPELSPQSFSFNSPLGMCVECNGLGERLAADPDLVVPDPTLSIRDGAVARVGRRDREGRGLDVRTSSRRSRRRSRSTSTSRGTSSAEKQREVLLHGTGDKRVSVAWEGRHSTRRVGDAVRGHPRRSSSGATASRRATARKAHYEQFFRAIPCARVQRHAPAARSRARCSSTSKRDRRASPA